jgi:hypothetical protein
MMLALDMVNTATTYLVGKKVSYKRQWMLDVLEQHVVRLRRRISVLRINARYLILSRSLSRVVSFCPYISRRGSRMLMIMGRDSHLTWYGDVDE